MSQMEQMNQAKEAVIETLKNYQDVLREKFQEKLNGIREHLNGLLKEGKNEEYKLCLEEKFMEGYTVVSRESVEAFLKETDDWYAPKRIESSDMCYINALEEYPQRDVINWNKIFRRHIGAITLLKEISKEYQKSQKALESFDESQKRG